MTWVLRAGVRRQGYVCRQGPVGWNERQKGFPGYAAPTMIIFEDKKSASTSDLLSPPVTSLGQHLLPSDPNLARSSTPSPAPRSSIQPPPYANSHAGPSRSSANAASTSFSMSSLSLPSTATGPISPSTNIHLPQRSNHLYITRPAGHIKGSWIIDTSLKLPAAMLPPIEEGTTRKNVQFIAKTGKISARVEVRGRVIPLRSQSPESSSTCSSFGDGRAHLSFRSESSNVKLRLRRTETPRIHVSCSTPCGSVTVYLPYDFQGPVRTTSSTGVSTLFLSPAILKRCTPIVPGSPTNAHSRKCIHFIGNCPGPEELWDQNDEVDIDARKGFIKILFVDERKENDHAYMKQVVRSVQNEGVVNYLGRVVTASLERSRERLAFVNPSLANLSSTLGTNGCGKIT